MMAEFRLGACPSHDLYQKRMHGWPLLKYRARKLFAHMSYMDKLDERLCIALFDLFSTHQLPVGGNFGVLVQARRPFAPFDDEVNKSVPSYYAARYGLLELVLMILKNEGKHNLEKRGARHLSTPLHAAAYFGHREVVAELLRHGAHARETNAKGDSGVM